MRRPVTREWCVPPSSGRKCSCKRITPTARPECTACWMTSDVWCASATTTQEHTDGRKQEKRTDTRAAEARAPDCRRGEEGSLGRRAVARHGRRDRVHLESLVEDP